MIILVVVLHVIVCFFLIAVILLQAGRGQGLSWGVFGGTPQSILGTKTASFLSRVTTGCAIVFLFTVITLNIVETRKSRSLIAPQRRVSQLDFSKIKQALEQAEKSKAKTVTAPAAAQTAKSQTVQTTAEPVKAPSSKPVPTNSDTQSPQQQSVKPNPVPAPPEKH